MGLALAAKKRGLSADVWLKAKERAVCLSTSVRNDLRKPSLRVCNQALLNNVDELCTGSLFCDALELIEAFDSGALAIILISTFRHGW